MHLPWSESHLEQVRQFLSESHVESHQGCLGERWLGLLFPAKDGIRGKFKYEISSWSIKVHLIFKLVWQVADLWHTLYSGTVISRVLFMFHSSFGAHIVKWSQWVYYVSKKCFLLSNFVFTFSGLRFEISGIIDPHKYCACCNWLCDNPYCCYRWHVGSNTVLYCSKAAWELSLEHLCQ